MRLSSDLDRRSRTGAFYFGRNGLPLSRHTREASCLHTLPLRSRTPGNLAACLGATSLTSSASRDTPLSTMSMAAGIHRLPAWGRSLTCSASTLVLFTGGLAMPKPRGSGPPGHTTEGTAPKSLSRHHSAGQDQPNATSQAAGQRILNPKASVPVWKLLATLQQGDSANVRLLLRSFSDARLARLIRLCDEAARGDVPTDGERAALVRLAQLATETFTARTSQSQSPFDRFLGELI
jgi:hypothetical protein